MNYDQWQELHWTATPLPEDRQAVLLRVATALTQLGPNSVALLDDVARRLVEGIPLGDWDRPLDLVAEATQETTDTVDYVTVEIRRTKTRLAALLKAQSMAILADEALRNVPADSALAEYEVRPGLTYEMRPEVAKLLNIDAAKLMNVR